MTGIKRALRLSVRFPNPGMRLSSLRALIAIAFGIVLAGLNFIPWWTGIIALIFGIALLFWTRGFSLYLALAAASFLYARSREPVFIHPQTYKISSFQGVVIEEPLGRNRLTVALSSPLNGKVTVYLKDSFSGLRYGDLVRVKKRVKPFSFPRNPGLIDFNEHLKRQGFVGSASARQGEIRIVKRNSGNPILRLLVMPVRRYLHNVIKEQVGGKEAALLLGMLLGERSLLPVELREAFTSSGLWHLFVVSGLHISIVVFALWIVLTVLRIRSWWRFGIMSAGTILYALVAGWNPASVRAAFMTVAVLLSFRLQRRSTPLSSLCVAGIILLLSNPLTLFNIGAQLSFAATVAIITIVPQVQTLIHKFQINRFLRNYLILPAGVSLAATIGTAPLLLHHFFQFQPFAFLSALLTIPLVTVSLPLALFISLIHLISPFVAAIFSQSLRLVLAITIFLINHLSRLKVFLIEPGKLSLPAVLYIYGLLILLINWQNGWARRAFRICLPLGLVIVVWLSVFSKPQAQITFLDPGRGDAFLIEDTLGRKLLIDAGIDRTDVLPDFLLSRGIKRLDAVILTHPDRDHFGGLLDLPLGVKINRLIVPTVKGDTIYQRLLHRLERTGTEITVAGKGARVLGFGYEITLVWPDEITSWLYSKNLLPTNPISIVTLVEYQGIKILFTGDCESFDVLKCVAKDGKINILKSPHHGSRKGNPLTLYETIRPEYAIVSGRYPTPARLEQVLPEIGIKCINTRLDGGTILRFKNGKLLFSP